MMSREEPAILYTVGCFEIDNQYVSLTNRVMKLVGANCVTLKKCGKFVEMILTRDFHDLLEREYILRSPFCPMQLVDNKGELCRILLEANFLDTDTGNKLYVNMFNGLEMTLSMFKKKDKFGILSKSFPELEIKLALRGF